MRRLATSSSLKNYLGTQSDTKRMNDRQKSDPRWLNGLYIRPLGDNGESDDNFNLQSDNWSRNAKVPNLHSRVMRYIVRERKMKWPY